ncbi:MAG TPA: lamin tail domain-containing protein [Phycisphaerales bacterium]|nr:lamin tail domain-containing protein [Phycisphaerales bacterium]
MRNISALGLVGLTSLAIASAAGAQVRITEWMYDGSNGEFIELTNVGATNVDFNGWSFDDDSGVPGSFSLTGIGIVAPGQSVIITEATTTAAQFRTNWGLSASIVVLAGNTNNLSRNDTINIYDNTNALVDTLAYGDQNFPGTIRTQGRAGVPTSLAALGANNPAMWGFADTVPGGGPYDLTGIAGPSGWRTSAGGQTGNPGYFTVPTPGAATLIGVAGIAAIRRRRSN